MEHKTRKLPTVADLLALKGKRQLTMLKYFSLDEAAAAEAAGIDIASVPADVLFHPEYRQFAPTIFSMAGQTHTECGSPSEYLKWCNSAIEKGADALYCSGSFETVSMLSNEYIPVVGHVGLVPARATWTGGFKAVGKTANDALDLLQQVKSYENAGAIGVELEVVPVEVADEISKRTSILVWSMGAGAGCDAIKFQLFRAEELVRHGHPATDILRSVEFPREWTGALSAYCTEAGIAFCASAFDAEAVDILADPPGERPHERLTCCPSRAQTERQDPRSTLSRPTSCPGRGCAP